MNEATFMLLVIVSLIATLFAVLYFGAVDYVEGISEVFKTMADGISA